jgi:hypothetical protein
MSFTGRIQKFAKSPEGKKVMKQAHDLAKDPHAKQKIEEARDRLLDKDEPAGGAKAAKPKAGGATAKPKAGGPAG